MDAISGFINPLQSRIQYLNITKNWSDILIESIPADMMKSTTSNPSKFYLPILKRNGMLSFAKSTMDPLRSQEDIDYEVYWRLCCWDIPIDDHSTRNFNTNLDFESEFQKHHYNALKSIANREKNNSLAAIERARQCILFTVQSISIECLQSVYKYLSWMELLQQADDFCIIQFDRSAAISNILENWRIKSQVLPYGNFQCRETMLAHQMALFNSAGVVAKRKIEDYYKVIDD